MRGTDTVAGIAGAPPGMGSGGNGSTVGGGTLGAPARGPLGSGGGIVLPGTLGGTGGGMIIMVGADAVLGGTWPGCGTVGAGAWPAKVAWLGGGTLHGSCASAGSGAGGGACG